MKLGDGLFLRTARDVARQHTDIALRRADRRRGVHAPGDAARSVRRAACCRTSTATSCRTSAPAWSAAWAWCRARTSASTIGRLRGRARQRARHRRQEPGEPDGAAALGAADAASTSARPTAAADPVRDLQRCSAPATCARTTWAAAASTTEFTAAVCAAIEQRASRTDDAPRRCPSTKITRAVLARDEVVAYLNGSHGESGPKAARAGSMPISTSCGPAAISDLPRAEASALPHPPQDHAHHRASATIIRPATLDGTRRLRLEPPQSHRLPASSRWCSTTTAIRPPVIAAGINLFGGPLGLIHRHVTGAIPIRRNTEGPGLPDHAQGVRRRDPAASTTCSSTSKAGAATAAS